MIKLKKIKERKRKKIFNQISCFYKWVYNVNTCGEMITLYRFYECELLVKELFMFSLDFPQLSQIKTHQTITIWRSKALHVNRWLRWRHVLFESILDKIELTI